MAKLATLEAHRKNLIILVGFLFCLKFLINVQVKGYFAQTHQSKFVKTQKLFTEIFVNIYLKYISKYCLTKKVKASEIYFTDF
jgi:hypothetical protein